MYGALALLVLLLVYSVATSGALTDIALLVAFGGGGVFHLLVVRPAAARLRTLRTLIPIASKSSKSSSSAAASRPPEEAAPIDYEQAVAVLTIIGRGHILLFYIVLFGLVLELGMYVPFQWP